MRLKLKISHQARTYLQLPLRQWGTLTVVQLKGKHCRKPHCLNGVVDTFGPCHYQSHRMFVYNYTLNSNELLLFNSKREEKKPRKLGQKSFYKDRCVKISVHSCKQRCNEWSFMFSLGLGNKNKLEDGDDLK